MRTHIADAVDGYQWLDQLQDVQERNSNMTDFSHLHALEERAVRIWERMIDVQKNDAQWKAQALQLFQTEKEIADEREFLGLEDMSTDDLYAGLIEEHESEVVREVTAIANSVEQAEQIRTAAEALVAALTQESDDYDGLVYYEYAKELADLQMALSRGWLSRSKAPAGSPDGERPQDNCRHLHTKRLVLPANKRNQFDEPFAYVCTGCNRTFGEEPTGDGGNLAECCDCGECESCREVLLQGESV